MAPATPSTIVDGNQWAAASADIARRLRAALGDETIGHDTRLVGLSSGMPAVRIEDPKLGTLYADVVRKDQPLVSDLGRFEGGRAQESRAPAPGAPLPVTIVLSATTSDDLDEPIELARAEWTANAVAGRQVRIAFRPTGDTRAMLASRVGDLRAFTPSIALQALDGEVLDPKQTIVIGETITLEGDRITQSADGTVAVDGETLAVGEPTEPASRVATVKVVADGTRFPDVTLRVWPRNAEGKLIEGLAGTDFRVTDEGASVGVLMRSNLAAPRILFVSDRSTSIPRPSRGLNAPATASLARRIEAIAKRIHPRATVQVTETNSEVWRNQSRLARSAASIVVRITDGDNEGNAMPDALQRSVIGAGPRVVFLRTRKDHQDPLDELRKKKPDNIFDRLAKVAKGVVVDVDSASDAEAEATIRRVIEKDGRELPYRLSYHVSDAKRGVRTARVTVGAAVGEDKYRAEPLSPDSPVSRKLASLRLTVTVGRTKVTRVLAGHEGHGAFTAQHFREVHGAMFGRVMLGFEGPPPSLSTVLHDVLEAKLSLEPFDAVLQNPKATLDDMLEALEKGTHVLPTELATLLARTVPLSGEGFCFAEQSMRCVMHASQPVIDSDQYRRRVDLLPLSRSYVLASDPAVRVGKSLEASVELAMAEAALFDVSTVKTLGQSALQRFDRKALGDLGLAGEEAARWLTWVRAAERLPGRGLIITPARPSVRVGWAIDKDTGQAWALLPDGSGGGSAADGMKAQLKALDEVVNVLNLLATAAGAAGAVGGIGGMSLGVVAAYGQQLARLYAAASMAIMLMDDSGIEPALKQAIAVMACEIAKSIRLGVFAGAGKAAARAVDSFAVGEGFASMLGYQSPFSCSTD
jgi:hypothetical protein